jgi:hypothetical protein
MKKAQQGPTLGPVTERADARSAPVPVVAQLQHWAKESRPIRAQAASVF